MIGVRASERKKRAELFEISADFSAFLTKFQHFSAHISALLCKVFVLNFLKIERISAHFLHNFWKFSRPGINFSWLPIVKKKPGKIGFFYLDFDSLQKKRDDRRSHIRINRKCHVRHLQQKCFVHCSHSIFLSFGFLRVLR